ncbi:hypothetical protein FGB62_267g011 [Gracilaria domingensis]|nr:hypothetical protein FGB62_267g011 [Gracilaria domingensis]
MKGRSYLVQGSERLRQALDYARGALSVTSYDIRIASLRHFPKALISDGDVEVHLEGRSEYRRRLAQDTQRARQRCWIAGVFEAEEGAPEISNSCEVEKEVFYGCIDEIWRAKVSFRRPGEQLIYTRMMNMVRVDWVYGMKTDRITRVPSVDLSSGSRRGSLRDTKRTVEDINSISHSIAFLDHGGRRHFLDPRMPEFGSSVRLGGVIG